jgi:tRNA pseudouridine38-40 synthase
MRIALGIEYNGSGFHGWQAQLGDLPTIQGTLEAALAHIANEPVALTCAGRTDAGVHATGQVVHFDTTAKRHIDAWIWGTNSKLPPSIVVRWARHVDHHFHARFTATARRYRFIIFNHPIRPAIFSGLATWYYYPLDVERMVEAGKCLIGEQDFSSFRASQCNSKSPMRNIIDFSVKRDGDLVIIEVEANAFLHHMVRNIVGTLVKIGAGFKEPSWMDEVLKAKNRRAAGETSAPDGLYLMQVRYPKTYDFPVSAASFLI